MIADEPYVQIRAWDLGGFGDIAGAMRTASHVHSGGLKTEIYTTTRSAANKLGILSPDVPVTRYMSGRLQVDVAGHYYDSRTDRDVAKVPHLFAEDMDNRQNRRDVVPVYLKSGLAPAGRQVRLELGGYHQNPMFYRPFREWDLPEPGKRDVRTLIAQAARHSNRGDLETLLDRTDRIAFGHFQPGTSGRAFLNSPYIRALKLAAESYDSKFALGLFFPAALEDEITKFALTEGYTIIKGNGTRVQGDPRRPAFIFLGPQSQLTTTSLFLAATMPNIVTGDLSLSDALYGLTAMEGQGFFYDCPSWKTPTYKELTRVLSATDAVTARGFTTGSEVSTYDAQSPDVEFVVHTLADPVSSRRFANTMREAVNAEISRRFGHVPEFGMRSSDGLYVPRGAPFLIQDAVENILRTLVEDPKLLAEVESARRRLAGEGRTSPALTISVDVMAPATPMNIDLGETAILSYNNIEPIISPYKNIKLKLGKESNSIILNKEENYKFSHLKESIKPHYYPYK